MENLSIKVSKKTRECNPNRIYIGNDGENLQSKIVFSFEDEFVDGQARIDTTLEIEGQNPYILLEKIGETYVLPIKSGLTKYNGCKAQLVITESNTTDGIPIFKSKEMKLIVDQSINAVIEQPEEYPDWLDLANAKLDEIDESITETNNLNIDATKINTTTTVTIAKKNGTTKEVEIHDGETGAAGRDGFSPIANVSKSGNITTINITDKNGTTTAQVNDGLNGQNGVDGFSPVANVSKNGNIATITITDKNGTTTATVNDGQNGTNGQNGITPTIGDNGNWYLGTTDTGKPSRGATGQNGADGQDGISPTATVSKSGTVATISITDKNGTTTATINDGTNGQNGQDGVGVPSGGTQGQVLVKSSGTDYDTAWGEASGGTKVFYRENGTGSNRFDFDNLDLGLYYFYSSYAGFQYKIGNRQLSLNYLTPIQFLYTKKFEDASLNEEIGTLFACRDNNYSDNGIIMVATIIKNSATSISNSSALYMIKNSGRLLTTQQQLIIGEKIFGSIPRQNGTTAPTLDEQFTNKKYVDDKSIQFSTLPTASSSNLGKIVQYTGTTDANYTNGYFYQVVSDGQATPTYSWENISVGATGGGVDKNSMMLTYYLDYSDRTQEDPQLKDMHDKLLDGYQACGFVKSSSFKPTVLYPTNVSQALLVLTGYEYRDNSDARYGVSYGTVRKHIVSVSFSNGDVYSVNVQYNDDHYVLKDRTQILGTGNNVSYTPSADYNPATKKYVDDAIGGALGGSY